MTHRELETDYLIIGSGAMGMAFADTLLTETSATMTIVDRYPKPGGHWNVAYPFVTLHQPSSFYGVSSKELSRGQLDKVGLNKGLMDLASGAEVSAYYDEVMRQQFLPSGRVNYFPMSDYKVTDKVAKNHKRNNLFTSLLNDDTYSVNVTKKLVDCTFLKTSVPSTHTPNFQIEEGVWFEPINNLTSLSKMPAGYVIIGGGKTGIDAVLWLLENNVNPDKIKWIMPRDAWLLDRRNTQSLPSFFKYSIGAQAAQFEAIAAATDKDDMFMRLEKAGYFLRVDTNVWPKMFRGATVSQLEISQLRRIKNIIRLGKVITLSKRTIHLEQGEIETGDEIVHVDCSARAVQHEEIKPIFEQHKITPQMVRSYQPIFSAAFIAHIEATYGDDIEKQNQLCRPVEIPNSTDDFIRMTASFMINQYNWSQDEELGTWLLGNRLDGFSALVKAVRDDETQKHAILKKLRENAMPAMMKLQHFISEIPDTS